MTRRSKPSTASDPIEQYTATQPINQNDPIEDFNDKGSSQPGGSRTAGPITPIARVLSGLDPTSSDGRAAK